MSVLIADKFPGPAGSTANGRGREPGGLVILWVFVRVTLVTALWLILFLAVFLGYITIPILLLSAFLLGYILLSPIKSAFRLLWAKRRAGRVP